MPTNWPLNMNDSWLDRTCKDKWGKTLSQLPAALTNVQSITRFQRVIVTAVISATTFLSSLSRSSFSMFDVSLVDLAGWAACRGDLSCRPLKCQRDSPSARVGHMDKTASKSLSVKGLQKNGYNMKRRFFLNKSITPDWRNMCFCANRFWSLGNFVNLILKEI